MRPAKSELRSNREEESVIIYRSSVNVSNDPGYEKGVTWNGLRQHYISANLLYPIGGNQERAGRMVSGGIQVC